MTREVRVCFGIAAACLATGNPLIAAAAAAIGVGMHLAERKGDSDVDDV